MDPDVILKEAYRHSDGHTLQIDLWYPGAEGAVDTLQIGMYHVRASDDLRISYDFDRDGWSIKQASRFSWEPGEEEDEDWQEVAFVQAWGRKVPGPGDEGYVWKEDRDKISTANVNPSQ